MSLAKWSVSVFYTSLNIPIKNKKNSTKFNEVWRCRLEESRMPTWACRKWWWRLQCLVFFHTKVSNRNTWNLQRRETETLESLRLLLLRSLKENFKKQQNIPRGWRNFREAFFFSCFQFSLTVLSGVTNAASECTAQSSGGKTECC